MTTPQQLPPSDHDSDAPSREELIARAQDLQRRAAALQGQIDAQSAPRWDRIGLVLGAALALTGVVYLATSSVLWAVVSVFVGAPVLGFVGVLVWAAVKQSQSVADSKTEVTLGEAEVLHDPGARIVQLRTELTGDALALFVACYFDLSVVRWGAREWAPSDPGGQLPPRVRAVAQSALDQLGRGVPRSELAIDAGTYRHGAVAIPRPHVHIDLRCRLLRNRKGPAIAMSEPMGGGDKGAECTDAFLAVLVHVLRERGCDARALSAFLVAQCDALAEMGSNPSRWAATQRALVQHTGFAASTRA